MEKKLNRSIYSLYAAGIIQLAAATVAFMQLLPGFIDPELAPYISHSTYEIVGMGLIFPIIILIAIHKIVPGLREGKSWSWIAAIGVLFQSAPGYALPASVFGLLNLLDVEVRTPFLKELDFKL